MPPRGAFTRCFSFFQREIPMAISMPALALCGLLHGVDPMVFPKPADLPAIPGYPEALVCMDGTRVDSPVAWRAKRRPELAALIQHYEYGDLPTVKVSPVALPVFENRQAMGGKAWLREFAVRMGPKAPPVHLLVLLPKDKADQGKPAPVFLGISFTGNQSITTDPGVRLATCWQYDKYPGVTANRATEASRGTASKVWNPEMILEAGYGLAIFQANEVDPDVKETRGGLQPWMRDQEPHTPEKWGTISLWAWTFSRMVDVLANDPAVDGKRIVAVGHSRLGKTVYLAAALDERISMSIPLQAGCGGTAPARGTVGESVKRINTAFPHWFNSRFKEFNDRPQGLPFDQHAMAALIAPRPVLFPNASEDQWANPDGQFTILQAADPVYRLLGVEGLAAPEKPPLGKLSAGRLGYWERSGKHEMKAEDWKVFLDFAKKHLGS